jgi:2-C-methyl-D-erythritol 4-phosphate cytidylyltransferase
VAFAIVAAGGRGSRLGSPVPKFELELHGKPLLLYSLEAFQAATGIEAIILVVPPERLDAWAVGELKGRGISKALAVAAGGATRQESVRHGLESIQEQRGIVVVHDAARPLVTPESIQRVCLVPDGVDGVITAAPVTDTIKSVEEGTVKRTLDRETLVAVQTPQAFRLEVLRSAHQAALREGFEGTDDAVLVERAGGRVSVVEGSRENIKVTFVEDLALADAVIGGRSRH